jgi:hypothetical protein
MTDSTSEPTRTKTAQSRYEAMVADRDPFLTRARECAKLTLPFVVPPEGATSTTNYPTPYQSIGARGVSTLAARLLITILPPNMPLFKLQLDEKTKQEMSAANVPEGEITKALSDYEAAAMRRMEGRGYRVPTFMMLRHLLISGNVLCYIPPNKDKHGMRVYPLTQFVLKRTPDGQLSEFVVKRSTVPSMLPPAVTAGVSLEDLQKPKVDLFIWGKLEGTQLKVHQEAFGKVIPGTESSFPADKCPWIAPRISTVEGECYGRSYVEEYIGDLQALETLSKAIVIGSAAAAKVLFFVRAGGTTRATDCNRASSGDFLTGDATDISTLQLEKYADFRVAAETIANIEMRLGQAFLLRSSIQRDAERVTAEEVRYMASELDDALGGMYSILAQEWQLPFTKRQLVDMQARGELPPLPEKMVTPVIVTGMEALGRTSELQKLDTFVGALFQLSPDLAAQYLNLSEYLRRRAAALSIDTNGLIRTEQEVQQAQQAAEQKAMMAQMGPEVIKQVGNYASTQAKAPKGA